MAFFDKVLIEKKSRFSAGSNKLVINANKKKAWEINLFNLLRVIKDKSDIEKFKKLLESGHTNKFFTKKIFSELFNDISIMFYEWNYNSAIKYYDEYLNFLVKTNNEKVIQNLDFLFFASDHHMKTEKYDVVRKKYVKLFEKYLLIKVGFTGNSWINSKDSFGFFTIKERITFGSQNADYKTMNLLMAEYNKCVQPGYELSITQLKQDSIVR